MSLDLRLVVLAGAGWLAVIWGLSRSAGTVLIVGVACLAIGAALAFAPSRRALAVVCTLVAVGIALLLLPLSARQHIVRTSSLWNLASHRESVRLELVTTADPVQLAALGPDGLPRVAVPTKARAHLTDRNARAA